LTGRRFDAGEALKYRLVTRTVPDETLLDAAWESARGLAAVDPAVMAAAKRALSAGADLPLQAALELETRLAATGVAL
jgi:enoyl-CoA hydratase/carnithine racemase